MGLVRPKTNAFKDQGWHKYDFEIRVRFVEAVC